jgi:hypothetical protein
MLPPRLEQTRARIIRKLESNRTREESELLIELNYVSDRLDPTTLERSEWTRKSLEMTTGGRGNCDCCGRTL